MDTTIFFPIIFSIIAIALLSAIEIVLLRILHKDWWRHLWVRWGSWFMPILGCAAIVVWTSGIFLDAMWMVEAGAYLAAAVFITGIALMLSLPFSALMHGAVSIRFRRTRVSTAQPAPASESRRRFVKTAAAAFPALAIGSGGIGLAGSLHEPTVPEIALRFPGLPRALEGMRILHISDVHIGFYIGLPEYEDMMEIAARQRADLVLLTGDISDRLDLYQDALRLAAQIPSKHGVFASIGNHEYYRGIKEILSFYEKSPVPLLLDRGHAVDVNGATLYLAGADDPRSIRKADPRFYSGTIDAAMRDAPVGSFTILMSHRPEGLDHAATVGIPLTLAGHTHGGQIGYGGRSLVEPFGMHKYAWGLYRRGNSQLYTTAGAGQWFPFRLGCPAEMPVYVLRAGDR